MIEISSQPKTGENSLNLSLKDLLAPLFRRRRLLIVSFLAVFSMAIIIGLLRLHKYESHMEILVSRERLDPLVTTEATNQMVSVTPALTSEEVNSEAELLKSRDVLEKVVTATGVQGERHGTFLESLKPKRTEADLIARAVRSLATEIKVDTPSKTNLIEVSYSSADPSQAFEVLNTLGNFYLEKHAAVHRPPGSYQFFAQQAETYRAALESSEARLRALGQNRGIGDPDEERTDLAVQLAAATGQSHATEQVIAADEQRIRSDQEQMDATPQRSATKQDTQAANLLLQNLGTSLLAAEIKRTQLLLKFDPNYPLVREADQEVAEAKAAIAAAEKSPYVNLTTDRDPTFEMLREDLAKNRADLAGERATLAASKRGIESMHSQMVSLSSQSLDLADLQREAKANEQNYLLYLSKREQERTSDALDRTRIENVAIAVPPSIPVLPANGFAFIFLLALCIALTLSLALTYTFDYLDTSFHTPAQVADALGIALVVAVPKRSA
jgi:succinoglycan biosynthesis transport protein ExoP